MTTVQNLDVGVNIQAVHNDETPESDNCRPHSRILFP